MATKKQLEQLAKFRDKAELANAVRKTAQIANGTAAKNRDHQEDADKDLTEHFGKRKAKRLKETEIASGGGKPRNLIRRFLGT